MEHTFLDLEAIVNDEDQEDNESDEDIEDFIDDSDFPDETLTTAKPAHKGDPRRKKPMSADRTWTIGWGATPVIFVDLKSRIICYGGYDVRVRKMGYAPPWYFRVESIDIAEWGTILHKDDKQHLQAGSWVCIKSPSHLFDPLRFRDGANATKHERTFNDTVTIFCGHKFIGGLMLKKISSYGVEEAKRIEPHVAGIYLTSNLPVLHEWSQKMPPPHGWLFNVDERVSIKSLGSNGIVTGSTRDCVQVWHEETSTTVETTYWDLRKDFQPGDFMVATTDVLEGHQGWVIELQESDLDIEVVVLERNTDGKQTSVEFFTTHANSLRQGCRKAHGTIEDVVLDLKIPSGVKVLVRYDATYDPNRPFSMETVAYEQVTERRSRWPLYSYCPLWPNEMLYHPQAEFLKQERYMFEGYMLPSTIINPPQRERSASPIHRCTPPLEGEHPPPSMIITMEDVAWNPRASDEEGLPKDHWIYQEAFRNQQLVVKADGVEKTIWAENDGDQVILLYKIGRATKTLKPRTLVPSHPTPRDTNVFVISDRRRAGRRIEEHDEDGRSKGGDKIEYKTEEFHNCNGTKE
ncbi:uncharacterized protein EV420DRAFT_1486586 [Desarmillaria tabescens]|uniref:Uncharacterized protein n=1 Tax=Armillaria tabescens TaxID=1929756 RepID=A0AA39J9W6_ARMTA|nr:uncharacterized protein EV420DRAFT_1486586 [Desarmillaria tabescens]KAK0438861.1 hypothetical protein EV420DRAFT_1486586 [Desarmillaria tabescens]